MGGSFGQRKIPAASEFERLEFFPANYTSDGIETEEKGPRYVPVSVHFLPKTSGESMTKVKEDFREMKVSKH